MGYAGYAPTKYAEAKSDLELALAGVRDAGALDLLATLMRNAVVSPSDEKFRRVKVDAGRLVAAAEAAGGDAFAKALAALGWSVNEEGTHHILPIGRANMTHVRAIEDAKTALKKDARVAVVKAVSGSARLGADGDAVRAAIAADAAERAAAASAPVKPAKAVPLPGSGANVARCADVGISG